MPTYQYACTTCGRQLEAVQLFTDAALTECPTCAGQLRKVFSAVGIVFKGSGFYRTDSRSGNPDVPATAAAGAKGKSDSKASSDSSNGGSSSDSSSSSSSSDSSASGSSKSGDSSGGKSGSAATSSSPAASSSSSSSSGGKKATSAA